MNKIIQWTHGLTLWINYSLINKNIQWTHGLTLVNQSIIAQKSKLNNILLLLNEYNNILENTINSF